MSKKELKVYFQGKMQKIKYYGSLDEDQLKKTVKQIFKINEPIEQIYFQDEDGDILILNDQIPPDLSIHIFVEPDSIPKNPSKELKVEEKEGLIKFHWIREENKISYVNGRLDVIVNKYLYTTVNDQDTHPHVRSSCTFEKGIHFFVLRKPALDHYTLLLICDEDTIFTNYSVGYQQKAIGFFQGESNENTNDDIFAMNLGILVDMEHKKCAFYDYDKKIKKKIKYMKNKKEEEGYEAPIDFERAKVVAWLKKDSMNKGKIGITILNEGCIPVPSWI